MWKSVPPQYIFSAFHQVLLFMNHVLSVGSRFFPPFRQWKKKKKLNLNQLMPFFSHSQCFSFSLSYSFIHTNAINVRKSNHSLVCLFCMGMLAYMFTPTVWILLPQLSYTTPHWMYVHQLILFICATHCFVLNFHSAIYIQTLVAVQTASGSDIHTSMRAINNKCFGLAKKEEKKVFYR